MKTLSPRASCMKSQFCSQSLTIRVSWFSGGVRAGLLPQQADSQRARAQGEVLPPGPDPDPIPG